MSTNLMILSPASHNTDMVAHTCNARLWEQEGRRISISRSTFTTYLILGQPGLHEALSQNNIDK